MLIVMMAIALQALPLDRPSVAAVRADLEAFVGKRLRLCGDIAPDGTTIYQPASPGGRHGRIGLKLGEGIKASDGCVVGRLVRTDGQPPVRPGVARDVVITDAGVHPLYVLVAE